MDVVLVTLPFYGHWRPLASIGDELVSRGRSVKLFSFDDVGPQVAREFPNLCFVSCGAFPQRLDMDMAFDPSVSLAARLSIIRESYTVLGYEVFAGLRR